MPRVARWITARRQIVFVDPGRIADLELTGATQVLYQRVLSA